MKLLFYITLLHVFVTSCSEQIPQFQNSNSNSSRNNFYHHIDYFPNTVQYTNNIEFPETMANIFPPLVLNNGSIVLSAFDGNIVITNGTKVAFSYKLPHPTFVMSELVADSLDNIYAISTDGKLLKLNSKCELIKSVQLDFDISICLPKSILINKEGVFIAFRNVLQHFTFDFELLSTYSLNSEIEGKIASDFNANMIFVNTTKSEFHLEDSLAIINISDKSVKYAKANNTMLINNPCLIKDYIVTAGSTDLGNTRMGQIYYFDIDGNENLKIDLPIIPEYLSADQDSLVYVVGFNDGLGQSVGALYCVNLLGKIVWKKYFETELVSPFVLSQKQGIVASQSGQSKGLYYFDRFTGNYIKMVSISNSPSINFLPVITSSQQICFAGSDRLQVFVIDKTPLDKILPYK